MNIERLGSESREAVFQHYMMLEKEDLRFRFNQYMSEWTIRRHVDHIDFDKYLVFGVQIDGQLAGVFEMCPDGNHADVSFSVAPAFRALGVGKLMVDYACEYARLTGLKKLTLDINSSNLAMLHLAKESGLEITYFSHGQIMGEISTPGRSIKQRLDHDVEQIQENLDRRCEEPSF